MHGADLIRIAALIRLAAQTAMSLQSSATNGALSKVLDIAQRIEAAAEELAEIGRELDNRVSET